MIMQSGQAYSADQLASLLGVSRRTLFRDLKTLQDAGINYDHTAEHGFQLEPTVFLPPINLKVGEALGLIILAKTAESQPGQPMTQSAIEAVNKLLMLLPHPIKDVCQEMMGRMTVRQQSVGITNADTQHYVSLQQAIENRNVVRIKYHSLTEWEDIGIDIRPYHLHFYARAWYVIAYSEEHESLRTFKLARIMELEHLKRRFAADKHFNIDDYFGKAWGMIKGDKTYRVELEFTKKVGTNVAEVQWHTTQKIKMNEDGTCRVQFEVDGIDEIMWWLLGYGDQVKVIKPKVLRDKLRKVYQNALDNIDP